MIIDSHAHLNDERFRNDLDEVLDRAAIAGIRTIVVPGYELASSRRAVELASLHDSLYAAAGISPHEAKTSSEPAMEEICALASHPRSAAVGEIGLDYFHDLSPRDVQQQVLREHLALARTLNKPVIVHLRDAAADLFRIFREDGLPSAGGVMHCFTGSPEDAQEALDLGLHVSFSGILVFAKNGEMHKSAAMIPDDRILVETDSPYLTPPPWRGKRNEPSCITVTLAKLAEIRGVSAEHIAELTARNAISLFSIEHSLQQA